MNTTKKRPSGPRRFHEIAGKLERTIVSGTIAAGERLPAERQLAASFGASRGSIREALRTLEEKGLLEIRRGTQGGAYVRPPIAAPSTDRLDALVNLKQLSLDQIAEFREAIEVGAITQAARVAESSDIRMLKYRLQAARCCMASGRVAAFIEADKNVHLAFALIAGNPLFTQSLQATLGMQCYFRRFHALPPSFMEADYHDLSNIVTAVEKHQPRKAECLARGHISHYNRSIA